MAELNQTSLLSDADLVGYWRLEGNSTDETANNNDGSDTGITYSTANGKFGQGAGFDGTNSVIDFGTGASFDFGNNGAFTWAGWVNPTALVDYACFVGKDSGRAAPYSYMLVFMANGGLDVYNSSSWLVLCPAGSIANGSWQHVAFSYDGTTMVGYVNGVKKGSVAFTYTDDANDNVYLGSWLASATTYDYNGKMDDIYCFKRALTQREIQWLYKYGFKTFNGLDALAIGLGGTALYSDANLKAYFQLESNGADSIGNYHLTTVGGSPAYSAQLFGNGMVCDNAESVSAVTNCGITTANCSIAFWLSPTIDISTAASLLVQLNTGDTNDLGHGVQYEYNSGTRRLFFRRSKWNVAHQGAYYNVTLGTSGWYHIVYTYDGTNVRGYVNGELVAGPTAASGNGSGTTSASTTIGTTTGTSLAAKFDDVAIFDKALSADEVTTLYNTKNYIKTLNGLAIASVKTFNGI